MTDKFIAACVQMRSTDVVEQNIADAVALITEAKDQGANFIATPEMTSLMEMRSAPLFSKAVSESEDPALPVFCKLAKKLSVHILIGSLAVRVAEDKCANRAFLLNDHGEIVARYDKIHMFDVEVGDGQTYRESKNYQAGSTAVVAELPWGKLGLSICYDVRFPYLYRALARAGAEIITVPAAFTHVTGQAHWRALLVARAIETGCFVIAPAQGGVHENGRHTYGHSLIIDPWGEILTEANHQDPVVITAAIDLRAVEKARSQIPSLSHDREITLAN
jgi:predicted amidohydrolase